MTAILASLALLGTSVAALSVGTAHVVNKCDYDVYLCNVPAAGGGYDEQDKTLAAGESWDQTWTSLSNGNGWSIKLSKSTSLENILQYEYTFHNDGTIWYDLSCVNGNPWDQDWEITASGDSCNPKQQAYRYATDDAYGMQSCPQDAAITVTLCTGVSADNGTSVDGGSSSSASAPSYESTTSASASPYESTSEASAPSYESSTTEEASQPTKAAGAPWYNWNNKDAAASSAAAELTPTTFATQTTAVVTDGPAGITITQVETAVVTNYVTAYAHRHRRHEHARAHQHDA